MALPPISVIVACVLLALGICSSASVGVGLLAFGALASGNAEVSRLSVGWALALGGTLVLQVLALVGLWAARRWAVILGASLLSISSIGFGLFPWALLTVGVFLGCTLPHWERMTWRFP